MNRAERRRKEKSNKVATYNFTEEQLDLLLREKIGKELELLKKQATEDGVKQAFALLLTIPMEVLMDHFWKKSYRQKIPKFTDYILEYYDAWENGKLDMDEMKEDLWKYGGVRIDVEAD